MLCRRVLLSLMLVPAILSPTCTLGPFSVTWNDTPIPATPVPTAARPTQPADLAPTLAPPSATPSAPTATARQGTPGPGMGRPTPSPAYAEFGPIVFCEDVTEDGRAIRTTDSFVGGTTKVWALFSHKNIAPGQAWGQLWERDGAEYYRATDRAWAGEANGLAAYFIENEEGLPEGRYTLTLFLGNQVAQRASFDVGAAEFTPINLVAAANGGRIVSATDEHERYPASNLIDGNKLDFGEWWSNEPPEFPQVIVFAFAGDKVKTINRVVLNPWTSEWRYGWVQDFEIHVSASSPRLADMKKVGEFTLEHVGIDQGFTFDPVPARYVALVITSHYGSEAGITLNEFEVYEAPPEASPVDPGNLVAAANGGRIVAFSSQDPNGEWSPEHLIDGRKDTPVGWSSSEDLERLQYVVLAFQGDKQRVVDRVVLNPYSEGYEEDWIQDFELRGSDTEPDPVQMQTIGRFRLKQVGEDQSFAFAPVKVRYIALVPLSNYGGTAFALNEFEVYGARSTAAVKAGQKRVAQPREGGATGALPAVATPQAPPQTTRVPASTAIPKTATVDDIGVEVAYMDIIPVHYHLYGRYFKSLATTTVTNRNAGPVKVRIEVSVPNYTEIDVKTVTLGPGETTIVEQNPPFIPGAFERLHSMKKASLHIQVDYLQAGEKRLVFEDTTPITIYSRDDFPWGIPDFHNGTIFAATMVMPNDPALDELVRVAADYTPWGIIPARGYHDEADENGKVWHRLKAFYRTVAEHYGVTYVSAGVPFVPRDEREQGLWLQRIKLPYEVLETRSGNCIELALLFASVIEQADLRPIIIMVPGHAFVAVPLSWDSATYYFLETTMVGQSSFEDAIRVGGEEFEEALDDLAKDRKDSFFWLDVSVARQEDIWPIPWR